jgi:hypothetical protein
MIREHLLFLADHFPIQPEGIQQNKKSESYYSISVLDIPAPRKLVISDLRDAHLTAIANNVARSKIKPRKCRGGKAYSTTIKTGTGKFPGRGS